MRVAPAEVLETDDTFGVRGFETDFREFRQNNAVAVHAKFDRIQYGTRLIECASGTPDNKYGGISKQGVEKTDKVY